MIVSSLTALKTYRNFHWRLLPKRQIATESACLRLLEESGFCLIFGSEAISLPKIYDAARDDSDWWNWKDTLQAKKKAYLGRLFCRKAALVSMDMLPYVLARYLENGGSLVADEEHYYGKLTHGAKRIADYLDSHGPTAADTLRKTLFKQNPEGTRRFHIYLFELQSKFKIVTVGLKEKGWGVRILGLFSEWVPEAVLRKAERIPKEEAYEKIIERYVGTAGMVKRKEWSRVFGEGEENLAALNRLRQKEILLFEKFHGREWVVSRRMHDLLRQGR
ncbi:MAG: hypothetical protein ABH845_03990 [Candidatus Omnitrophota bacterium]